MACERACWHQKICLSLFSAQQSFASSKSLLFFFLARGSTYRRTSSWISFVRRLRRLLLFMLVLKSRHRGRVLALSGVGVQLEKEIFHFWFSFVRHRRVGGGRTSSLSNLVCDLSIYLIRVCVCCGLCLWFGGVYHGVSVHFCL